MKIIFLGLLFNEQSLKEAYQYSKSGVQMAPHFYQSNILEGLKKRDDVSVNVISIPPVGSFFKNYKKLVIPKIKTENDVQVGYLNIPLFKHFFQRISLYKEIKKLANINEEIHLIIYSLYKPFLVVAKKIKKKYKKVKITLIQTDAVFGRNGMRNSLSLRLKGDSLIKKSKIVDNFIVLSEQTVRPLEVGDRPYMVMECIANTSQKKSKTKEKSDNIFLYTGETAREYGLLEFIDAFDYLKNAKLWICGKGNAEDYIVEKSKSNSNIKYFGYVSQSEVKRLRDECDFVVNPRRPTGTFTRYSFPSKTAEFLLSGKPTVMYHLEAIPKEYDKYLNYLSEYEPKKIAKELKSIMEKDYSTLVKVANSGRRFMLKNKGQDTQAQRFVDFLKTF